VAGALIVREHQDLVFISREGMVQRTGVRGISQQGRAAQGVTLMNLREDDVVSAVALVMEDEADTSAVVQGQSEELKPIDEVGPEVDATLDPGVADEEPVPDDPADEE
jgi:DNA gyrase subunit A